MNIILAIFLVLALMGFLASLAAHIAGYMGIDRPFGQDPWPLHMGIFVVWIPAMLVSMKLTKGIPNRDAWKVVLGACPSWMRIGAYVLFGYAILSFIVFFFLGSESNSDNEASVVRGFSGHWLLFYYAAIAILYAGLQPEKRDPIRRCPNGHVVELADRYCRECGDYVGKGY